MKILKDPLGTDMSFDKIVIGLVVTAKPSNDSRVFDDTSEGPIVVTETIE